MQNLPKADKQFGHAGFNTVGLPAYTYVHTWKYFLVYLY